MLIWVTCFGQYGTALHYLQYLKNFCEIEGLSTDWYDNSIISWKKGAVKLKIANGFKYIGKRIPFTWEWITALVKAFDQQRQARVSLFLLVCWAFLLRPLSEAFQLTVGNESETASLPENKHSGIWVDRTHRGCLRLRKRKHRPRGSYQQRVHTCFGQKRKFFCCLPCRLEVALKSVKYGDIFFERTPHEMMLLIKTTSYMLEYDASQLTWKSFRVGHATHLAITGESLGQIMAAGEWRNAAFAAYVDPNSLDAEVFLNQTMVMSDNEDEDDEK